MNKSLFLCLLALTGCATTPQVAELSREQLSERFQRSAVSIRPVSAPAKLVERTKGQAVGNFLIASVVSSVAMSNTGARTASEMQTNMEVGQSFGQNLNEALPTGSETEGGGNADILLTKRLRERFQAAPAASDASPVELIVSTILWELGYESFLSSSDYALKYALDVSAVEPAADKPRFLKRIRCQGNAPKKMTLDEWRAENYQAVDEAANEIADRCFQLSMQAFGLE